MRVDRLLKGLAEGYFLGKGFATDLPGGVMAFLKSPLAAELPDVQLLFAAAPAGPAWRGNLL